MLISEINDMISERTDAEILFVMNWVMDLY